MDSPSTTVTQKKTLKIQRPGFKRPTVSGLRKPGSAPAADSAAGAPAAASSGAAPAADGVADLTPVADIPDIKPLPPVAEKDSGLIAGAPAAGPNDLASFHSETDYRR